MANKTQPTKASVKDFIASVESEERRKDCLTILEIMQKITGCEPVMWGESLVGFDTYQYKYASGRSGEWFCTGFSPRKQNLTLYIMPGYQDYGDILKDLGPHKIGKCCLYLKNLDNIHLPTLKKLIKQGYKDLKENYKS